MGRPKTEPQPVATDALVCVLDSFLDWCQNHKAARTYDWYRDFLESFARSLPGGLTVVRLKPFQVQLWLDANTGWKTSKRGAVIAVQRAFHRAVRMGLIAANLIRSLEKPKAGRRDHVIPVEQFKTMCSLIRDDEFRELLTVCWETGCRPQEVLSVEARHVDATVGCWVFPVSKSKGKQQQRNVYLTDTALTITRRLMTAFPRGPLFRNTNGRPRSAAAVNRRFARLRLALGRQKIEVLGLTTPKLKRLTKAQRNDVATASAS